MARASSSRPPEHRPPSERELRGLLLPDLDGIDSAAEQVSIAMRKAGIRASDEVHLQRFEVRRFEEHDAEETN